MIFKKTMLDKGCAQNVLNASGTGGIVFVCEHASNFIPPQLKQLGLSDDLVKSHIAWDPGALELAKNLSAAFDAPLVASTVSRLVYDCNRPPEAADAIPSKSEIHEISGNSDLSAQDKQSRVDHVYLPFTSSLKEVMTACLDQTDTPVMVTIHSFTPTYKGQTRDVEIGILHDKDTRLADAILDEAPKNSSFVIRRNEPYGPENGVTHTLQTQALSNGFANVMIEVRNDLINDQNGVKRVALDLIKLLETALETCQLHNPKIIKEDAPK